MRLESCATSANTYSTDGCPFFRGNSAGEEYYEMCLECMLEPEIPFERQKLRPCFLDERDGRATFLRKPSAEEYTSSINDSNNDATSTRPSPVWEFMLLSRKSEDANNQDRNCLTCNGATQKSVRTSKVENDYSIYAKLRTDTRSIRLFRLHKGRKNQRIVGEFFEVDLFCNVFPWVAVSYCWGGLTETRNIYIAQQSPCPKDEQRRRIHRREFRVTANLEMALRALRKPDRPVVLWIDALCINQADLDERTSQVGIIREIYAQASSVAVWLGAGDNACHKFGLVRRLGLSLEAYLQNKGQHWPKSLTSLCPEFLGSRQHLFQDGPVDSLQTRVLLEDFFSNPW